jgi:hypothetical protein
MPLSDTNSPSGVSTADPEVARSKLHLSPQAMQAIYLKGLILGAQKAARSAKVTSCLLSMWYTDDGTVSKRVFARDPEGLPELLIVTPAQVRRSQRRASRL